MKAILYLIIGVMLIIAALCLIEGYLKTRDIFSDYRFERKRRIAMLRAIGTARADSHWRLVGDTFVRDVPKGKFTTVAHAAQMAAIAQWPDDVH